jgi:hypothetical protein
VSDGAPGATITARIPAPGTQARGVARQFAGDRRRLQLATNGTLWGGQLSCVETRCPIGTPCRRVSIPAFLAGW